jgi:putative transposase
MRKRYSEDQIVKILEEVRSGKPVTTVSREYGISGNTIHRWRNKYGDMQRSEVRRLKELEQENRRLKHLLADQMLDNHALKDLLGKYS